MSKNGSKFHANMEGFRRASHILSLNLCTYVDVCQCPDSIRISTASTGANSTESIDLVSVCSGKPCEYNSSSNFITQVTPVVTYVYYIYVLTIIFIVSYGN